MEWTLFFTCFICVIGHLAANKVEVHGCKSKDGTYGNIDVSPCPEQPCKFKKGTNITLSVDFTPYVDIYKLTSKIHGKIGPIWVPFPFGHSDACKDQGFTCPLKKGKTYTLKSTLYVKSAYPAVELDVKWEDQDQNEEDVLCWILPAEIVD